MLLSYVLSKAFYEIFNSMLWEVRTHKENQGYLFKLKLCDKLFWMSVPLAWGTLRLIGLRIGAKLHEESKWGFGQILPILLSFLPLWWKMLGGLQPTLITICCNLVSILMMILKMEVFKSSYRPHWPHLGRDRNMTIICPSFDSVRSNGSQSSKS